MLKRLFAWIGLMRRRFFGQWGSTTPVVTPPPPVDLPANFVLLFLLLLEGI